MLESLKDEISKSGNNTFEKAHVLRLIDFYLQEEESNTPWYQDFNFCGCGMPNDTMAWIADVLSAIKERSDSHWTKDKIKEVILSKPEEMVYFVLYFLDAVEFTEHGSSVGASWLTDKGENALNQFKTQGATP